MYGEDGHDVLVAGGGTTQTTVFGNTLSGGAGDDTLYGGPGVDDLSGNDGNDLLIAASRGFGYGDDLFGEAGNDTLRGSAEREVFRGGTGNDLAFVGDDEDTLRGEDGNDLLFGGRNSDLLYDDFGRDTLRGEDGNDSLWGDFESPGNGGGNDVVVGDRGNDTRHGGPGQDVLRGGFAADSFVFERVVHSAFGAEDQIEGMNGVGVVGGDVIVLPGIDADRSTGFNDAFTFLGVATMAEGIAAGAGVVWVMDVGADWTGDTGARIRVLANVDDDGSPDFALRIREAGLGAGDFTAEDFILRAPVPRRHAGRRCHRHHRARRRGERPRLPGPRPDRRGDRGSGDLRGAGSRRGDGVAREPDRDHRRGHPHPCRFRRCGWTRFRPALPRRRPHRTRLNGRVSAVRAVETRRPRLPRRSRV